ncbi:MAG: hypothetical protein PF961_07755 [Planctomycetota bacterium]|jgi:hypothetical protein|nr:hypothetical protein [Planctomycetota bacterium]
MPTLSSIAAGHPGRTVHFYRKAVTGSWHTCPKCRLKFCNHSGIFFYRKTVRDYGKGLIVGLGLLLAICLAFLAFVGIAGLVSSNSPGLGQRLASEGMVGAFSVGFIFSAGILLRMLGLKHVVAEGQLDACPRCFNEDLLEGKVDVASPPERF